MKEAVRVLNSAEKMTQYHTEFKTVVAVGSLNRHLR